MWWTALIPFILQCIAIAVDEGYFHFKRGLPKWERIGHPLDTLTVIGCFAYLNWMPVTPSTMWGYGCIALFSSLFVTKDEWVHAETCSGAEQWLHALLFSLHPLSLGLAGLIWMRCKEAPLPSWIYEWLSEPMTLHHFLQGQLIAMTLFCLYQILFWNFVWNRSTTNSTTH